MSSPVFREIADKVYSIAYMQYGEQQRVAEKTVPVSKNGLKTDFRKIFDGLGLELDAISFRSRSNTGCPRLPGNPVLIGPDIPGRPVFHDTLQHLLYFFQRTEGEPYIKHPGEKEWTGITLPWMSIGYELKITPLQVLAFYNAIANDGQRILAIPLDDVSKTCRILIFPGFLLSESVK